MDNIQDIQEKQYHFPYHYILEIEPGFKHFRSWSYALYYASSLEFIYDRMIDLGVRRMLDIGCGDGRLVNYLNSKHNFDYLGGFDYSTQAIELAKIFNPDLDLFVKDIFDPDTDDLIYENHCDCHTLIEVLEHIPLGDIDKFIDGLGRIIKPGAFLILTVPHSNVALNKKHYQHFSSNDLKGLFENDFEIVNLFFLHEKSILDTLIRKLLYNKLFVLNARPIREYLYRMYVKYCLFTDKEEKAMRNLIILKRKPS